MRSVDLFEPPKLIEPKSSSQRKDKESGKSQSIRSNKSPQISPQPKENSKKSSVPVKSPATAVKEKPSAIQRPHPYDINESQSANEPLINSQHYTAPLLSDSIKIVSDNKGVLERMKDIDLKLMELQTKKSFIDEQIQNLHKEKNVIDQTSMQLQNERFLLLSSLLTTTTTVTNPNNSSSHKRVCEAQLPSPDKKINHKITVLSSDEENKIDEVKRSLPTKGKSQKALKRKVHNDVDSDSFEDSRCKKIKINVTQLKSSVNIKNKLKIERDELQSDLKPKKVKSFAVQRCSIRLTKLSSKKIKLMTEEVITDEDNLLAAQPIQNNTKFDGNFCGHRLPIVHLQVPYYSLV